MSTYNGYTNFETWLIALHIDNDAKLNDGINSIYSPDVYDFSNNLKDFFDEMVCHIGEVLPGSCLPVDLLNAALSAVNWSEIATLIIEDNK